jgi:hypothetical protein
MPTYPNKSWKEPHDLKPKLSSGQTRNRSHFLSSITGRIDFGQSVMLSGNRGISEN